MSVEFPDKQNSAETNTEKTPEKRQPDRAPEKTIEEVALETSYKTYLQAERTATDTKVQNDIEFSQSSIPLSMGYVPTLEALLKEMEDKDDWLTDSTDETTKEQILLQNASVMIRNNLQQLSMQLDAQSVKSGQAYEKLRTLYVERSARLTELVGCIDDTFENTEIRDGQMAARQAMDTIKRMTPDEAIDWVQKTMSAIDGNNWQSSGLKETYGLFANACKQGLRLKLAEEKQRAATDPKATAAYVEKCMAVAKLFTDRGSPIDGNLCDMEFAADMARQAMQFEELAMRYANNALNRQNPLSQEVDAKRPGILQKMDTLPEQTKNDPQVVQLREKLTAQPTNIQGYVQQYAIVRSLERMFAGEQGPFNPSAEIESKLTPVLENAVAEFETFLNGSWGGAASLEEINAVIGTPGMNADQVEAWTLLSDIQGYGYDVGDKTWSYIGLGAKIAGMIVAGVAVGIATGGLGVIAGALSGGATMTVTGAVMNQQGFDNITDATSVYGKDMAINTATMGVSRYLTAGRMAFQATRTGAASGQSVKDMFMIAGQRGGMRALGEIDDAANIGTRIMGATLEGTADTLIGTTLDTAIQGGTFLENLQNNAMFMGLGYGELGGSIIRKIRGLPDAELQGISQLVNKAGLEQEKLRSLCNEIGVDAKAVFNAEDMTALLKDASDEQKKAIGDACDELKNTRAEFEKKLNDISQRPEISDEQLNENNAETPDEKMMRDTIMTLPDTPDGYAKRIEAGTYLLGMDESQMTDAMRAAIIDAHNVPMSNGSEYTMTELVQKMRILRGAGFSQDQADMLMRMGVCGSLPPPPPPPGKKPSSGNMLPKPPPPVPGKTPAITPLVRPRVGPPPPLGMVLGSAPSPNISTPRAKIPGVTPAPTQAAAPSAPKRPAVLPPPPPPRPVQRPSSTPTQSAAPAPTVGPKPPPPPPAPKPRPASAPSSAAQANNAPAARPAQASSPNVLRRAQRPRTKDEAMKALREAGEKPNDIDFLEKYGNLTPEQLVLEPELENKLNDLKKRGLFSTQHYYEGKHYEWMDISRHAPGELNDKFNEGRLSDLRCDFNKKIPGRNATNGNDADTQRSDKDNIHEVLSFKPLTKMVKTGTKTVTINKEEPGWLWGKRIVSEQRQDPVYEEQPIIFSDIANTESTEKTVRLTYAAWGYTSYTTNTLNKLSNPDLRAIAKLGETEVGIVKTLMSKLGGDEGATRDPSFKPGISLEEQQEGMVHQRERINRQGLEYQGRPGNKVLIGVTLPESEARALMEYFQEHPEMIRPFFLRGGRENMLFHLPPPFEQWDQNPGPIELRTFSDSSTCTNEERQWSRP